MIRKTLKLLNEEKRNSLIEINLPIYRDEKLIRTKNCLLETSLNKIMQHTKDSFFIISAFRDDNTLEKNLVLNEKLRSDVRKEGLGFIELCGRWIENKGKENEKLNREISLFVPYNPAAMNNDDFISIGLDLMVKYNQDAVVIKELGKLIYVVDQDRNVMVDIGEFNADKIGKEYSTVKYGSHAGRNFVFEGYSFPKNYISAMSMRKCGYILIR